MSDFKLYEGDCLEVMPTLQKGGVSMCFADLPYGVSRNAWDSHIDLSCFWPSIWQILSPKGAVLLTATQPFTTTVIASSPKTFRYDLVWQKINFATGFLNAKRMPLRNHESCLVFARKTTVYNPQMTVGTPYTRRPNDFASSGKGYDRYANVERVNTGVRYPKSVLSFRAERCSGQHPTQKPVALLEWLIATYTNPGDLVLDPVMGSGTTGVACANLGRRFIGIEKDATYFAAAKARIEKAYADAATGPAQKGLAV